MAEKPRKIIKKRRMKSGLCLKNIHEVGERGVGKSEQSCVCLDVGPKMKITTQKTE
jgi:hypothetical protein